VRPNIEPIVYYSKMSDIDRFIGKFDLKTYFFIVYDEINYNVNT